jgi:hypothetical protein
MTPLVTPAAVGMSAAASARLGRLLTIDALITVGGTVMLLATWVFELRSGVVLGLAASVGGGAVVMALGHLPHRRGRPDVALGMLAGANWALSIVVSPRSPGRSCWWPPCSRRPWQFPTSTGAPSTGTSPGRW